MFFSSSVVSTIGRAGFHYMYRSGKIENYAGDGHYRRRQERNSHPMAGIFFRALTVFRGFLQPNFLPPYLSLKISPNLLPTPGNSDSRSSSDFPISWGENKKAYYRCGSTPFRKRMRTCHQNTGIEPNKYFYIQQIRCQAEHRFGSGSISLI